ncbi:hypothetical protein GLAREA_02411 [Glarea lozoyensis ATCC 20868]|uniref:Uncharacterized protein n=1 Tax=Glarea lozoyensis (strain ATCC 20868 / MF5171) TaxID=1116229 RepID=S3DIW8_GLAL2|nr:uncharacterized protein GLAREA_02411 [Glarea lozoyensis ATCC 20868]EPE26498.1 hypothetical protein GLAREA_02411 [Glarea lozoyensis ATCC 20868]
MSLTMGQRPQLAAKSTYRLGELEESILNLLKGPSILGRETINLYIGPQRKKLLLHTKLITQHVPPNRQPGAHHRFRDASWLAHQDVDAFIFIIDYMYDRAWPTLGTSPFQLLKIYALASRLGMCKLMDRIMVTVLLTHANASCCHRTSFSIPQIRFIHTQHLPGSKMRKYIALSKAYMYHHAEEGQWNAYADQIGHFQAYRDDIFEMVQKYGNLMRETESFEGFLKKLDPCDFCVLPDEVDWDFSTTPKEADLVRLGILKRIMGEVDEGWRMGRVEWIEVIEEGVEVDVDEGEGARDIDMGDLPERIPYPPAILRPRFVSR